MKQSIREVIETTEKLTEEDKVKFVDEDKKQYTGTITEIKQQENHKALIFSSTVENADSILEIWYDREGGPITVKVSSGDKNSKIVHSIQKIE